MIRAKSFDTHPLTLSIPVIAAFIFLAIIRLTNFNFILSNLVGFETEINELGGNAFNFINYAGAALTGIVLFSKVTSIRTRWISLWPFFILLIIYSANALFAPYSNTTWFFYQFIFLATAFTLHIYAQNCTLDYSGRLRKSLGLVYWLLVVWVVFAVPARIVDGLLRIKDDEGGVISKCGQGHNAFLFSKSQNKTGRGSPGRFAD